MEKARGIQRLRVSHLELPDRGRHLAVASLREGQHAEFVGFTRRQVGYGGLQIVSQRDDCLCGLGDVLVVLPDPDLEAREGLLGHAGRHEPPGHPDGGRVDPKDLDSGRRFLGPQLERSLEEPRALKAGTFTNIFDYLCISIYFPLY